MPVPLTLKVFKSGALVASRDYDRDIIKIGRLASAHLCLDDDKVSRIHSVIEVAPDGRLSIIDMGSVEGTYVNGKRVNKGVIAFGDEIRLGNTTIRVEDPGPAGARAASAPASVPAPAAPPVLSSSADAARATAAATLAQSAPVPAQSYVQPPVVEPVEAKKPAPRAPEPTPATKKPTLRAESRLRPSRRAGGGPLGLEVRLRWGDQILGEQFLAPAFQGAITVGSSPKATFDVGETSLPADPFQVVTADGHGFTLHFAGKMGGELERKGQVVALSRTPDQGLAQRDGDGFALALEPDDVALVQVGRLTFDLCFQPVPEKVAVPLSQRVDWTALNIFLLVFFLGAVGIVATLNRAAAGDEYADELSANNAVLTKLLIKPPEVQKNPLIKQLNQSKEVGAQGTAAYKGEEGKSGRRNAPERVARSSPKAIDPNSKDQARLIAQKIFGGKGPGGTAVMFGSAGLGGTLQAYLGGIKGTTVGDAGGVLGMGLKGSGGGGGGTGNTLGIGSVGTKGVAGGQGSYGTGMTLGGKKSADIAIAASEPEITGSIDRELIRRVVRSHLDQLRYCYDVQLTKNPKLSGKVAVKWVVSEQGTVSSSVVVQTTTGNSELDTCVAGRVLTWVFPKPKGGGVAVVTYPFIFKEPGT
ncbi:MAG TPA: adventurous gliding motility protein GltG [Myxococcaceae bacterium]|nr:adventurous gliding motility protein GltG [Myxococcaceae bacterium]